MPKQTNLVVKGGWRMHFRRSPVPVSSRRSCPIRSICSSTSVWSPTGRSCLVRYGPGPAIT